MVLIKHSVGSKSRSLHNNATSKFRSRPLVDKQALSTVTRPLLSSLLLSATRRRPPPRPRPTAESFFNLYEPNGSLSDIWKRRATPSTGMPSVASSSTLEDDIRNSRILSSLAETTDGRTLDASYFDVTYRNSTLSSFQGPEDHYAPVCASSATYGVAHGVALGPEEADDLPDFEPDFPEPGKASFMFDAGVNATTEDGFADVKHVLEFGEVAPPTNHLLSAFEADACSDTDDGDSDSDLQDGASISANAYQNKSVSAHEAISFLDNVLFPFEESGLSLPSPILPSPQPTPQSFVGSRPLPLGMADYQDAVFDTLAPLDTHSYMDLAMGDGVVYSDSFVVYPFLDVAPTQECFPGHQLLPLVTAAYQDADSGAPAPRIMIPDTDLVMGDEATHPAGFVAFPTSTTVLSDSLSDSHSYDYMVDVGFIPQIPWNTALPTSFWIYRESVQIPDNDNDLFGLRCMSYDNMELCEADDIAMAEDSTVDLLTNRFASSLRLDVDFCAKCSAPQDPFCRCCVDTIAHCNHCSVPLLPHYLFPQLRAHLLLPSDPLLAPPYPRVLRTIWHPPLPPLMDVAEGYSLDELLTLALSEPNAGVTLDWRRRRRKSWTSWRLR